MRTHGGEGAARKRNMENKTEYTGCSERARSQTYGPARGATRARVNMERACMQMHVQIRALCID